MHTAASIGQWQAAARYAAILVWCVVFVQSERVDADVTKPEDIAACNAQAHDAVRPGSTARSDAVPNTKDYDGAASAQQRATTSETAGVPSPDAQFDGTMRVLPANDPAYRAAFRGCMRRKGF